MDRRMKNFGIGALVTLLMVSMLAAPAAAFVKDFYTMGPDVGGGPDSGCRNETGGLLLGDGELGTSDIGIAILDVDKDGIDGFDPDNPPHYLAGDDIFLHFHCPDDYILIGQDEMGRGAFLGTVGEEVWADDRLYFRLFNANTIGDATYYGDSIEHIVIDANLVLLPNWDTTIEINWGTETFEKDLEPGWNLVSLPLTPDNNSTPIVLTSITGNYDAVMKYTPGTGFESVATTVMDPGIGYFIYMSTNDTWSYDGDSYNSINASLSLGLNMAGWVNDDVALPGALDSIAGNYNYVARWNTTSQSYEVYEPDAPASFNDFGTIAKGEGYFIAANTDCTLTYP
ncbi:MAG: hypothetical protein AEth_01703 [Candidatus Argoarchaeum ethanivorans]|uniref:Uncharacterized protein n=1 Tax=Candidatus Argoarchaeum ethanivorans TaxID=2608793 RepID=A0A8B3S277_9EURY|nr:MAG: hypothetical protein AEth_01703 [Candidatus Argoarchaeum ethanivorans]